MAQKIVGYVRFQVPAGKATPAPPVGPALGQYGVNIGQFTKDFNERTKGDMGMMIPVVITVYADRSFYLHHQDAPGSPAHQEGLRHRALLPACPSETRSPPSARKTCARSPSRRCPTSTAPSIESAMSMIAGTCRSMGVLVGE